MFDEDCYPNSDYNERASERAEWLEGEELDNDFFDDDLPETDEGSMYPPDVIDEYPEFDG
jgi:hypothetical protein